MDERNQEGAAPRPPAPPAWAAPIEPDGGAGAGPALSADPFAGAVAPPRTGPDIRRGLSLWLLILLVLGVGSLLVDQAELAGFVALAGLFVAAQAADLDPRWSLLYMLLAWVVPIGSALTFMAATQLAISSDLPAAARAGLAAYAALAALVCLALIFRPFANLVTVRLFREDPPTRALRLTTRLVVAGILLAVPGALVIRDQVIDMLREQESLFTGASLASQLLGTAVLALAAVGFQIRRDWRQTLARLGIGRLGASNLILVAIGAGALSAFGAAAETLQHRLFPELWADDRAVGELLVRGIGWSETLMLGLAAGVGEEITLRGALQPRLGILLTSALFAALHVQYSWYGMLVIFTIGAMLGLMRARTNTSVAIAIHALYDVLAVAST
jgi:hypothetical protein